MTIRASRGVRLIAAAAMAWLGLALCAQAAHATYGKVTIAKVNNGGAASDTFAFTPALTQGSEGVGGAVPFPLKGGAQVTFAQVVCNDGSSCPSGNHNVKQTVKETPTAGYTLTDITCRYTLDGVEPTTGSAAITNGTISLAEGTVDLKVAVHEWVKCWYTNTPTPTTPPVTPPTPPTPTTAASSSPAPPAPQIAVSPVRVRPGSARLRGPSGCPTTSAVAATVTGRRIVKVTFYVDNKKVKTLTRPNRKGGQWVLPMNVRRFAFGTHRVRARIEFARSSQTRARTLRLSFNRCRPASVTPKFTG
jgi:hypothetical protein